MRLATIIGSGTVPNPNYPEVGCSATIRVRSERQSG
jgi:hypothetical protein